jgi:hypothetical protein
MRDSFPNLIVIDQLSSPMFEQAIKATGEPIVLNSIQSLENITEAHVGSVDGIDTISLGWEKYFNIKTD